MRIAVIGSSGQLGNDVVAAFQANGDEVVGLSHDDIELSSYSSVEAALSACAPQFIVNTGAMHHVEKCEADPIAAYSVNAIGAKNVSIWAKQADATVAYVSTDYVFNGNKRTPYLETDLSAPINAYGITKLAGEHFTSAYNPKHFILRVSAIYGHHPCRAKGGLNFVELMLKLSRERAELRVVDDEFVSPTLTNEIAAQLVVLSKVENYGLYHATAEGNCSWYEFAREIFNVTGTQIRLEKARPGEFPAKVPRPKYSVLENAALKAVGLNVFTDWHEGLQNYLRGRDQTPVLSAELKER